MWVLGVRIPGGFEWDGYTGPWCSGLPMEPSLLHDWLYTCGVVSRREADRLFREALWWYGVGVWRRWLMWGLVRLLGGWRFRLHCE